MAATFGGFAMMQIALVLVLAAASAAAPAPSAWPTFTSRQAVKDAFDKQAFADKSDRTEAECADVHAVMSCSFVIEARANYADDVALFGGAGKQMPDEMLDITAVDGQPVKDIGLDGNGRTPMHRYHYIGQFKTLVRVLSPGIGEAEVDRLTEDLGLGSTPQNELRRSTTRPFGEFSCIQGGLPSAYIQCAVEAPK